MKTMTSKTFFGIHATLLLCATPAAAQDSARADAMPGKIPLSDVHVGAYAGAFMTRHAGGVLGIGARFRLGPFEVGGFGEVGLEPFHASHAGLGATVGFAWRSAFGLRLAGCGAFGLHAYQNVGAGYLTGDPGADGSTPFAGVRAGASYLFGHGKNHIELGMMLLYDGDLDRRSVTIQYMEEDWFNGYAYDATSTHTIGTDRFGAVVHVGWTRDFL